MKRKLLSIAVILSIGVSACTTPKKSDSQIATVNSQEQKTEPEMKSLISIFEIPATDFARAVAFYQAILSLKIEEMDMQGMQMGLFPGNGETVSGVIVKGEGYNPSADGVVIYLNGGENLQSILDLVEPNGGQVIVPKTLIDEENGYFAMFIDTEGNRLGLHSPN